MNRRALALLPLLLLSFAPFVGCADADGEEGADAGSGPRNRRDAGEGTDHTASSSSGGGSSSSSGSAGTSTSSGGSSGASSSSGEVEQDAGPPPPDPGTPLFTAAVVGEAEPLEGHLVAAGASDGSFALVASRAAESGSGDRELVIEKRRADGSLVWSKTATLEPGNPSADYPQLALDTQGNVYIALNILPGGVTGLATTAIDTVRANAGAEIGECLLARLDADDGDLAWRGHVTLASTLASGAFAVECRGLAVRGERVVVGGNFPSNRFFYAHDGAELSVNGSKTATQAAALESFLVAVDRSSGAGIDLAAVTASGSSAAAQIDSLAIGSDDRVLFHAYGSSTVSTAGSGGTGPSFTPSSAAGRHADHYPVGSLTLGATPTGKLAATETFTPGAAPIVDWLQTTALPSGGALFGFVTTSFSAPRVVAPNGGATTTLGASRTTAVLTHLLEPSAPGTHRIGKLGNAPRTHKLALASNTAGVVAFAGTYDQMLDFGEGCRIEAPPPQRGFVGALASWPNADCAFFQVLPEGVVPSDVAVDASGRVVLAGSYDRATTFADGVSLPAPTTARAPFVVVLAR